MIFGTERMETIPETSAAAEDDGFAGEGLGLFPHKVARTETLPFRRLHPLSSSSVGPTFFNGSECRSSDLYDVAGSAGAGAGGRTLQPFSADFNSPGVGIAASMRFPFTSLQWQELERQTLIYEYMMASLPVPPDLIISICSSRTLSDSSTVLNPHSNLVGGSGCFNLRFSNNIDPEPGRCRRTDGKKWRCSRDVAPDQKYCERHMHRGRPRSRKPVEVSAQNQSLPAQIPPPTNPDTTAPLSSNGYQQHHSPGCFPKPESNLSSPAMVSAAKQKEPRYFETMAANPQWQMLHRNIAMRLSSNAGTNAPVFQPFDHPLKLDFPDFSNAGSETARNDQCCLYLNTLEDPDSDQRQHPKGFIDAWSITSRDDPTSNNCKSKNSSVLKDMNLPVSSLSLSIPSGDGTSLEDMDQIQMGLGVNDSEGDNGSLKQQQSSWVNSVPWLSSTSLGGPLGEVLQSGAAVGSNSAFINGCNSSKSSRREGLNLLTDGWEDGGNPLDGSSRLVSSPSCVLHKTLVSPSDSSGCSSPTFAAAKTENSLQWLCHSKLSS